MYNIYFYLDQWVNELPVIVWVTEHELVIEPYILLGEINVKIST